MRAKTATLTTQTAAPARRRPRGVSFDPTKTPRTSRTTLTTFATTSRATSTSESTRKVGLGSLRDGA